MEQEDKVPAEAGGEKTFAELLAGSSTDQTSFEAGEKVEATVLKISDEWVFLDIGRKEEGFVDVKELRDAEGQLKVKEGDKLQAFFLKSGDDGARFTVRISEGAAGRAALQSAFQGGIPVDGRVAKEIKGGFEVRLAGGIRAFCPYSQMDLRRVENGAAFVGQNLAFKVTEYGEKGRTVIVSRRALLEGERAKEREAFKSRLVEGMTVTGTVTGVRDFGAFVDIGGIEGLLPVSEVGWSRVENIRESIKPGQEITVIVKALDWDRDRITFSLRDTVADPWLENAKKFTAGSTHTGKVVRLAPFGAFVNLADGVDGLIHISKLGKGKRIKHPREEVKEGQMLEVVVEKVDAEKKQISLGMAGEEAPPSKERERGGGGDRGERGERGERAREREREKSIVDEYRRKNEAANASSMGTLGEILKARMAEKKQDD